MPGNGEGGKHKAWKQRSPVLKCPRCHGPIVVIEYRYYKVRKGERSDLGERRP